VTFDNISSWLTSVQIKYTLKMSAEEPSEQLTISRMRFGDMIGRDGRACHTLPTLTRSTCNRAAALALDHSPQKHLAAQQQRPMPRHAAEPGARRCARCARVFTARAPCTRRASCRRLPLTNCP
jgi:hypothetical protein